ncbi:XAC2610-related protein [Vibrio proteolyticus]
MFSWKSCLAVCVSVWMSGMSAAMAASTYAFETFSPDYSAQLTLDVASRSERDLTSENIGVITVFNQDGQPVITHSVDQLALPSDLSTPLHTNVLQIPYGEQSALIYQDLNLDGRKDFALQQGWYSCYGGPSYSIYLAREDGSFSYNEAYSALASQYCGMFEVDAQQKALFTMTKSGCCWHKFDVYRAETQAPVLAESTVVVPVGMTFARYTRTTYSDGKNPSTALFYLMDDFAPPDDAPQTVLTFRLQKSPEKQVVVYISDERVDYALINANTQRVEFSAELAANRLLDWQSDEHKQDHGPIFLEQSASFVYRPQALSFQLGKTRYTIIDEPQRVGVEVQQGQQSFFLRGDVTSRNGSLTRLKQAAVSNLKFN